MSQRSEPDLWRYHAYVYGFRRVMLAVVDHTSPVDELGDWFNPEMAAKAERFYRLKFAAPKRPMVESDKDRNAAEAREQFARDHGCEDFVQVMKIGINRVAAGAGAMSAENRKARWEQKMFMEVRARLPDEEATTIIQGYISGDPAAIAFIEEVDASVKAKRAQATA